MIDAQLINEIVEEIYKEIYKEIGELDSIEAKLAAAMFVGDLTGWDFVKEDGKITGVERVMPEKQFAFLSRPYMSFFNSFMNRISRIAWLYRELLLEGETTALELDQCNLKEALVVIQGAVTIHKINEIIDIKVSEYKPKGSSLWDRWVSNIKLNMAKHQEDVSVMIGVLDVDQKKEETAKQEGKKYYNLDFTAEISGIQDVVSKELSTRIKDAIAKKDRLYGMDPVKFAMIANIQIDGDSAMEYAIKNHIKIDGMDPIEFVILREMDYYIIPAQIPELLIKKVEQRANDGQDFFGRDPIRFAVDCGIKIKSKDPIVWALKNAKLVEGGDPIAVAVHYGYKIQGEDPIVWAVEKGFKIYGEDPIAWAVEWKYQINKAPRFAPCQQLVDPLKWAVDNNKLIEGEDPIVWAEKKSLTIESMKPPITYMINMAPYRKRDISATCKKLYALKGEAFLADLINLHESYGEWDLHKNSKAVIKREYNKLIQEINTDSKIITLQNTKFDKASSYTIARKIDKVMEGIYRNTSDMDAATLLKKCDFDMALKIVDIGKELKYTKENHAVNYIYAAFDAICECLKKMFLTRGDRVTMDNICNALSVLSSKEKIGDMDIKNESIKTFAERASTKRESDNNIER